MTTVRVWATHPAARLAGRVGLILVAVGFAVSMVMAGSQPWRLTSANAADRYVAGQTVLTLSLLGLGLLWLVVSLVGPGHRGRHRERPARQMPTVPPAVRYLPGRASVAGGES